MAVQLAAFLPSILGVLGSLFKGNKTKQAPQQTPFQLALTQYLTNLAKNKIGSNQMGYDVVNQMSDIYGMGTGKYGPQQGVQPGGQTNPAIANIFRQQTPRV